MGSPSAGLSKFRDDNISWRASQTAFCDNGT